MKTKTLYTDEKSKSYIEMSEYREGISDERDNVYSYSVRSMTVRSKSQRMLKRFKVEHCKMGKGRSTEVADMLRTAKQWLGSYTLQSEHPTKNFGCNCMIRNTCGYLRAGDDGRAKCAVSPSVFGYSIGPGSRDVPESRKCDLFVHFNKETSKSFGGEIPGYPLTMSELWECISGSAKLLLYPEGKGVEGEATNGQQPT